MTTSLTDVGQAARRYADARHDADAALTALLSTVKAADQDKAGTRAEIIAASGLARRTVYKALDSAVAS